MFGSFTREELRRTYAVAWRKHTSGAPLTPLEAMLADVIVLHPEYHAVVGDADAAGTGAAQARDGEESPFLHLGLHMAVREQASIDRPPGVRDVLRRLAARLGDPHRAEHALMDALAETLWEAQQAGHMPDEARYLERIRARLSSPG